MATLNLQDIQQKVHDRLDLWKDRKLSLTGRVLVVNTLIESMFVYKLSVLSQMDEEIIARV